MISQDQVNGILRAAVAKWGHKDQIQVAIEELGELIVKLAKYDRNINGSTPAEIFEEVADVELMLKQLKFIFQIPDEYIDRVKNKDDERWEVVK